MPDTVRQPQAESDPGRAPADWRRCGRDRTPSVPASFINSVLVPLFDADPSKVQLLLIDPMV
jgi:hypothetical protein